jgi:hypothetical protein
MRHSENKKKVFKKRRKEGAQLQKRKKSAIIAARKDISPRSVNRPKLIMRKPTIPKKNENEKLKKSPNRENLEKF